MTTALFVLRCKQSNFTLEEIDKLPVGFLYDIFTEAGNDNEDYAPVASQEDFDRF